MMSTVHYYVLPETQWLNVNIFHFFSTSKSLCRLAFQPSGKKYLAVPVDKEVKVILMIY